MRDFDKHAVKTTPETSPWLHLHLCLDKMAILQAFAAAIIAHCRQKRLEPVVESERSLKKLYDQLEHATGILRDVVNEFTSGADISSKFEPIDRLLDGYFKGFRDFVLPGKTILAFLDPVRLTKSFVHLGNENDEDMHEDIASA